jgi:hypothetical protein
LEAEGPGVAREGGKAGIDPGAVFQVLRTPQGVGEARQAGKLQGEGVMVAEDPGDLKIDDGERRFVVPSSFLG